MISSLYVFALRLALCEELRTSAFLELAMVEMEQEALAFENSRSISGRPWTWDKNRKDQRDEKDETDEKNWMNSIRFHCFHSLERPSHSMETDCNLRECQE